MTKYYKIWIILLSLLFVTICPITAHISLAYDGTVNNNVKIYSVYDNNGHFLFDRDEVEVGDEYISPELIKYEIYAVSEKNSRAYAKQIDSITLPDVTISPRPSQVSSSKQIALYMSHNDESYIVGDGVDSIYGAGGIHDVASALKGSLERLGVNVYLYENMHIPHDSYAYSRSRVTAKSALAEHDLDAIFDIHRDGASRKTYVVDSNGEKCKVRIVIGKGNESYSENLKLATYMLAVARNYHPWLFLDIYMGKGHYNQDLSPCALLFEMGSHMVEKSLVEKSVPALAEVINVTLFGTTLHDDESIMIGSSSDADRTVSDVLNNPITEEHFTLEWYNIVLLSICGVGILVGTYLVFHEFYSKKHGMKKLVDTIKGK